MRAYHRIDPLMDERKGHYTPAQFGAFLKVQLMAGRQTRRGRFRSTELLKGMLPPGYARCIAFLVEQGDIIPTARHPECPQCPEGPVPRGEVYVDGWDEWQEGDLTVRDRMTRLRNKNRNRTVTEPSQPTTNGVTEPSPTAIGVGISVGVGVGSNERDARGPDDIELAVRRLRNGNASEKQIDTIRGLFEQVGDESKCFAVLAEWEHAPVADRYGKAQAELVQLSSERKRSRSSRAVRPTAGYDRLMETDDDETVGAA